MRSSQITKRALAKSTGPQGHLRPKAPPARPSTCARARSRTAWMFDSSVTQRVPRSTVALIHNISRRAVRERSSPRLANPPPSVRAGSGIAPQRAAGAEGVHTMRGQRSRSSSPIVQAGRSVGPQRQLRRIGGPPVRAGSRQRGPSGRRRHRRRRRLPARPRRRSRPRSRGKNISASPLWNGQRGRPVRAPHLRLPTSGRRIDQQQRMQAPAQARSHHQGAHAHVPLARQRRDAEKVKAGPPARAKRPRRRASLPMMS